MSWLPLVKSSGLLLDTLSATPIFAVSSRKLLSAYSGNALKVTTSAAGNSTQDIGFVGSDLDTASLATFIGANSGTITTWYDQSPSVLNATNVTVAQQPTIVSSGTNVTQNGHVWAAGTSADSLGCSLAQTQPYSVAVLAKVDVTAGNTIIGSQFVGSHIAIFTNGGSAWAIGNSANISSGGTADTSVHTIIGIFGTSILQLLVDGVSVASGGTTFESTAGFGLWDFGNSVHIGEVLMFAGALSAGDQALIQSSWHTYWGAPP